MSQKAAKQGGVLSPTLFALFISGLGQQLEQDKGGVPIFGTIISGLFYADDLVLIGKNKETVKRQLSNCQFAFECLGMDINCDKSNIITLDKLSDENLTLKASTGDVLGEIRNKRKYKYLGINIGVGKASSIFLEARKTISTSLLSS